MKKILITGGAGFIGSNLVRYLLKKYPDYSILILDALTYCGSLDNFPKWVFQNKNFSFIKGDIRDQKTVRNCLSNNIEAVVHLAAESHVDRSITSVSEFIDTDVKGTQVLLDAIKIFPVERFIHISTSEVYGTAQKTIMDEKHPLNPQSPYAASKCGGDRLAYSYYVTYDLPIIIIRPFNNYGPNQYPEKLIPLFITNALQDKSLPVYGTGKNTRDWIYVEDHCIALDKVLHTDIKKLKGEVINLGSGKDTNVLKITNIILKKLKKPNSLIKFIKDRPGHVEKHLSSTSKAKKLLDWQVETELADGLEKTIKWYIENKSWWKKIKEKKKEYINFYKKHYGEI